MSPTPGPTAAPSTPPLVALTGVSKRFGQPLDLAARAANLFGAGNRAQVVHAPDGIDLQIRPGEVVGLVGESGSEKSTLGRVVAGLHPPTEGKLVWEGKPVADMDAPPGAPRPWPCR